MQHPAIQRESTKKDLLHSLGRRDYRSSNDITVAADVLRGRVHDDVHAVRDGLLEEGGRPAVVDARECTVLASDISDRTNVEGAEHHRSGTLEPDNLRV